MSKPKKKNGTTVKEQLYVKLKSNSEFKKTCYFTKYCKIYGWWCSGLVGTDLWRNILTVSSGP
jgi:hypothetical protein